MGLQQFIDTAGASMAPEVVRTFDETVGPRIIAAQGTPPGPPLTLDLSQVASTICAPSAPTPEADAFFNAFAADVSQFMLAPLATGAAAIMALSPPPPAPPYSSSSSTIVSLASPPVPSLVNALFQWAASLAIPGDPRAPGGFTIV